jgi:hypothetical protein
MYMYMIAIFSPESIVFIVFVIEGNITAGRNMFGRIQGPLALYYFTKDLESRNLEL